LKNPSGLLTSVGTYAYAYAQLCALLGHSHVA
jgi:hypothetical protein